MPNQPKAQITISPAKEREPKSFRPPDLFSDLVDKSLTTAALAAETPEELEWLRQGSCFPP